MARKGRARRFKEARELKEGFDDGLFEETNTSLADVEEGQEGWKSLDSEDDEKDELFIERYTAPRTAMALFKCLLFFQESYRST